MSEDGNEEQKKGRKNRPFIPPFPHVNHPYHPPPMFPPPMGHPPYEGEEDDFDYEEEVEIDSDNIEEFLAQGYEIEVVDENEEANAEPVEIDKSQVAEYLAQGYVIEELVEGEEDDDDDAAKQPKGRSLVGDKNFKRMHAKIIEAAELKQDEILLKERKYAFLKLMSLIFLVALMLVGAGAGISVAIDHFGQEDGVPDDILASLESKEPETWTLSSSIANDAVKEFFLTVGPLDKVSKSSDEMVRGLLRLKGKEYSYKALKSRYGKNYIALTDADNVETGYFFPSSTLGRKLLEKTISGPSEIMDLQDEELLRAVMTYDEVLLAKAFPLEKDAVIAHRMLFENRGLKTLDDIEYYTISVFFDGREYYFYFDKSDSRLQAITYERESYKIKIKFSDYRRFSNALEFPALRQVWINDELLLTATSSYISRLNEVLLFPH